MKLDQKKITICITGSIAAYKAASLVRLLIKEGAEVRILMTEAAKQFITPLTLATLSKNAVHSDFFNLTDGSWNSHVDMGLWSDLMIIAPASANTIAKMAHGVADNLVLTSYLSAKCPVLVAPAMDLDMYKHPANQSNLETLKSYGNRILEPTSGELASGLIGKGRMEEPEKILDEVLSILSCDENLKGQSVMITAGPTYENIDPVRFIGNYSSGKMGFALAEECAKRGADVFLISGPVNIHVVHPRIQRYNVISAEEMYEQAVNIFPKVNYAILCAAVADFTTTKSNNKIKSSEDGLFVKLLPTKDIAKEIGRMKKPNQTLVGFALESDEGSQSAKEKLEKKNLDMIVLNSLMNKGAGFGEDTNKVSIFRRDQKRLDFPLKSKRLVAIDIINNMIKSIIILLGFCLFSTETNAQEIKCNVTVAHNKIQGTNNQIYKTLEGAITSFMNGQKWTSLSYGSKWRIDCNLFLNLTSRDGDHFVGELQIQSRRPIFNSSYNSTVLNHKDNEIKFTYKEFDPLIYNQNQFESNLVAILSFYAYYIIALDQDTYSINGGDDYYKVADQIINQGQNSSYSGWKAFDSNNKYNRYWMNQQALSPDFRSYREFLYNYHIKGLDIMANKPMDGRKSIVDAFPLLMDSNEKSPSSMLIQMLFDAKSVEFISVLSQATEEEKKSAIKSLKSLDPSRSSEYNKLLK